MPKKLFCFITGDKILSKEGIIFRNKKNPSDNIVISRSAINQELADIIRTKPEKSAKKISKLFDIDNTSKKLPVTIAVNGSMPIMKILFRKKCYFSIKEALVKVIGEVIH